MKSKARVFDFMSSSRLWLPLFYLEPHVCAQSYPEFRTCLNERYLVVIKPVFPIPEKAAG